MKITVFLSYLFLLLQSGGGFLYAIAKNQQNNHSFSIQNLIKNTPIKFLNNDQSITLFDENDLYLEEDNHNNDGANGANKTILFGDKFIPINLWCTSQTNLFILNYYNNRFKIFPPFLGNSYPIYISQRALRI